MQSKDIQALEKEFNCIIPEKRVKTWEVELELFDIFDRICRKYSLKYFFCWGALLGAVRHQGFIPWDDDIDVVMPREDYDKLSQIPLSEIEEPYFLMTKDTIEEGVYCVIKLMKETTTCMESSGKTLKPFVSHQGICIDIVPLDAVSQKRYVRTTQYIKERIYFALANQLVWDRRKPTTLGGKIMRLLRPLSKWYCAKKGRAYCIEQYEKTRIITEGFKPDKIMDSGHHHIYNKTDFDDVVYLDFEGRKIPAPIGYENVLKELYGNYYEVPNVQDRMMTDHEATGYIVDPYISYSDYLELTRRHTQALKKERMSIFRRFCIK